MVKAEYLALRLSEVFRTRGASHLKSPDGRYFKSPQYVDKYGIWRFSILKRMELSAHNIAVAGALKYEKQYNKFVDKSLEKLQDWGF